MKYIGYLIIICSFGLGSSSGFAQLSESPPSSVPTVIVTVAPIHALIRSLMPEESPPILLIENNQSPHTYHLKPSQMRQLQQADLVIWVGESLESFLPKSLATLSEKTKTLALLADPNLIRLFPREGGAWEKHQHDGDSAHDHDHHNHHADHAHDHHDHHADHAHDHHNHHADHADQNVAKMDLKSEDYKKYDAHIWLSPDNAKHIVQRVARELAHLDPMRAQTYHNNAKQAIEQITLLDKTLQEKLEPIREKPYIVFHDAYFYFENHYQLNPVGSITISPESRPSAKRLHELRHKIKQLKVQCVFSEPQFKSNLVNTIIDGTPAKAGILDPLYSDPKQTGIAAYSALLQNLADQLLSCLK